MPLYVFKGECGCTFEKIRKVSDFTPVKCEHGECLHVPAAPSRIIVDFRPGFDEGLGCHIETKQQRDRVMKEKGLVRRLT